MAEGRKTDAPAERAVELGYRPTVGELASALRARTRTTGAGRIQRGALIWTVAVTTVGGRAGARLAGYLPVRTSQDVILRELRRLPDPPSTQVSVLGIDEFAFRRGATYDTVLIDVETRRLIDLLPNRSADAVAAWLAEQPEIKIICPDRCRNLQPGRRPRGTRRDPGRGQMASAALVRPRGRTNRPPASRLPAQDAETGDPDYPEELVGPRRPGLADRAATGHINRFKP
ncbi:transposase [Streptomyces sp. NPDC056105]|uniref:transposase n=1 Tax=Streptomyces sp. NPDC056105 TaxID=3345714 RepID=UPI0035D5B634